MYDFINNIVGLGNVAIILGLVLIITTFLFSKKNYSKVKNFILARKNLLGFILSVGAMLSSLYYSEIIGFAPCKLCWIVRIGVYPTAIFFTYALIKKTSGFEKYSRMILWTVLPFSLYHNFIYYVTKETSSFCAGGASCIERYLDIFGFLSIPLMGLVVIVALLYLVSIRPKS